MPPKSKKSRPMPSELSQSIDITQEDTKTNTKTATVQVRWTEKMLEALLEALHNQFQTGKATDGGGFKAEAWNIVVEATQKAAPKDTVVEELACHNKWTWYKDIWKNFKILEGMSGFGWNEEAELFTADNEVWDSIAKVYDIKNSLSLIHY